MPSSQHEDTFEEEDLDWCVDKDPALCAMSTAEIVEAVAAGTLSREARAWRVGLEAWAKISEIPELAGALDPDDALALRETAVTPPAVEITQLSSLYDDGEGDEGAASVLGRSAEDRRRWKAEHVQRGAFGRIRGALFEARWVFAGAAVAAASIGLSMVSSGPAAAAETARSSASSALARVVAKAAVASSEAEAKQRSAALAAARERPVSARSEPGQKRLRGRGARARGSAK